MPAYSTILGLYKPGGGSTGSILPDEPVDIDKINQNFDRLDSAVGAGYWASSGRPVTPYVGQIGFNTTLDTLERWNGTTWGSIVPSAVQPGNGSYATLAQLNAGALDNRYYTQSQLSSGQLDGRYYTQAASDTRYARGVGGNYKVMGGTGVTAVPVYDSGQNTYTTTFTIDFSAAGFTTSPIVSVTPQSGDTGYVSTGITAQPTTTTATGILRRRNAFATGYWWSAIGI